MSKVVFVGNVPYNMGEDQLIDVFKSVGQVIGFRLVFDRDTGKAKGYGFCEFSDHETALSAVRNLNQHEVGGRPLRIDLADSDPFLEGKTTVRGELLDSGYPGPAEPRAAWRTGGGGGRGGGGPDNETAFMSTLPAGKPPHGGVSVMDTISTTLATIAPNQLLEVLAQMKAFIITHPEQAKILLAKQPQLSYALFQALLLHRIVPEEILFKMQSTGPPGPPMHAKQQQQQPYQQQHHQQQQHQQQQQPLHRGPPPPQHQAPPPHMYQQMPPQYPPAAMPPPQSAPMYPPQAMQPPPPQGYYRQPPPRWPRRPCSQRSATPSAR
ncbi:hypothetical protein D9611_009287 [Ephemerocybe angulata]|uniref:RRM domain-containing protein n=1 Tax=Ephemerocybe angulata TaxID=980116 RepID=A0A8H5F444_9AGAR|nr:hypothetical protein D9611_009287 [Tulosesus angulatus]